MKLLIRAHDQLSNTIPWSKNLMRLYRYALEIYKDLSDPNIQAVAKYAVDEHNKQITGNLVFVKILKGKEQVVAGKTYSLTIAAKNGGAGTKNYEAVVVETLRSHHFGLQSFKAL
ncbi:unnamed protein product [Brassica rapa subsp. narinosa]